ncbi:MAG: 4Fe-4S dicluster domain-containing protein [Candidatus Bathyarchaeia archaeon]
MRDKFLSRIGVSCARYIQGDLDEKVNELFDFLQKEKQIRTVFLGEVDKRTLEISHTLMSKDIVSGLGFRVSFRDLSVDVRTKLLKTLSSLYTNAVELFITIGPINRYVIEEHGEDIAAFSSELKACGYKPMLSFRDDFNTLRSYINKNGLSNTDGVEIQRSVLYPFDLPGEAAMQFLKSSGFKIFVNNHFSWSDMPKQIDSINTVDLFKLELSWLLCDPNIDIVFLDIDDIKWLMNSGCEYCSFTIEKRLQLSQFQSTLNKKRTYKCAGCHVCMPCPVGILIPRLLELHTVYSLTQVPSNLSPIFQWEGLDPSLCTSCGVCEERCPRKLPIARLINEAICIFSSS